MPLSPLPTLPRLLALPAPQRGLALRSLAPTAATHDPALWLRAALAHAHNLGATCITLDCTQPGFRPRELDGSARRELAVLFRRCNLALAGLDCFVPTSHLQDASPNQARAIHALVSAVELLRDLLGFASSAQGSPSTSASHTPFVAAALPTALSADILAHLGSAAAAQGLAFADAASPSCFPAHPHLHPAFDVARFTHHPLAHTQATLLALSTLSHVRLPAAMLAPSAHARSELDLTTLLALLSLRPQAVPLLLDAPASAALAPGN
jgi:hypothetical protein